MSLECRTQLDLRRLVDEYLKRGWEITSRNPLTLERGRMRRQLRHGCIVEA
ncbi:hypothetical protein [Herbaspirillum sp.]|jgi:hypothetical protein|uniref:hypothetical protein n=1 Tax=Herbaspirillum sp. TaxID=1890675 RepID=UPI00257D4312|nr:hypothetical protein [Herbaspirillum sp.]|tara:strand:- start:29 stop:181 length:153 start_codon:yes stop_codon:yes gene_type:complete